MPDKQPSAEGADFKGEVKPTEEEKLQAEMKAATEEIIKKADELNVTVVAYLENTAQGILPRVAVVPKPNEEPPKPDTGTPADPAVRVPEKTK